MRIGITDIESNSLYNARLTKFHCAWLFDPSNKEARKGFKPDGLSSYISELKKLDVIVGHNIIDYDCCALHLLSENLPKARVFDTIVLSRMLFPDRPSHSLKSWGLELGILKGDYGEAEEGEDVWESYNEDMYEYCEQDVEVTTALFFHLCRHAGFDPNNPPFVEIDLTELEGDFPYVRSNKN